MQLPMAILTSASSLMFISMTSLMFILIHPILPMVSSHKVNPLEICQTPGACQGQEYANEEMNVFDCVNYFYEFYHTREISFLTFSYDDSTCALYTDCEIYQPEDCPSCFSFYMGKGSNCTMVDACNMQRPCTKGEKTHQLEDYADIKNLDACLAKCDKNNTCQWASFTSRDNFCVIYDACSFDNTQPNDTEYKTVSKACFGTLYTN